MLRILLLFALSLFSVNASIALASQSRNLTIFAEPNLALPLTKIARQYSRDANVIVSLNFTSANSLLSNIDSGEPVDLFISAHNGWIEMLHQKGVVDIYNIGYITQDELVLTMQKNNSAHLVELNKQNISILEALEILNRSKANLIIDEPNNSSGYFSGKFLEENKLKDIQVLRRLSEDKMPFSKIIKNEKNSYSLLLKSQIHNQDNFQILAKSDQKIFYQALVIAGDNMEVAREFLKFLKSDQAKKYLTSHGFGAK